MLKALAAYQCQGLRWVGFFFSAFKPVLSPRLVDVGIFVLGKNGKIYCPVASTRRRASGPSLGPLVHVCQRPSVAVASVRICPCLSV